MVISVMDPTDAALPYEFVACAGILAMMFWE
jgi:hypothetical protein